MVEVYKKSAYSEERARDFFKFHLFKINPTKYIYFSVALSSLITALVFILIRNLGLALFFIVLAIIVLIVRLATTSIIINRTMKKLSFPTTNYELTFNKENIKYQDSNRKDLYVWKKLVAVYETKNYFYFYVKKNNALVLPKFNLNDAERQLLLEIIESSETKYKKMRCE